MKKEKINKEKKQKLSLKQKIINNIQSKIQSKVVEHDKWLVDKICHRIEILALDMQNNYDLDYILTDIKNDGYLLLDTERRNYD